MTTKTKTFTKAQIEKRLSTKEKNQIVFVYFIQHPEEYEKFEHDLTTLNLLCHMVDGLMTDMEGKFKYLTDQSCIQLIKNAKKSVEKMVDKLYELVTSYEDKERANRDYEKMQASAVKATPVLSLMMNYCLKEGMDDWRVRDIQRYFKELIPDVYREQKTNEFKNAIRKMYKSELEYAENHDKKVSENTKKMYHAIETVLVS